MAVVIDTKQLRVLAEKATPGPWTSGRTPDQSSHPRDIRFVVAHLVGSVVYPATNEMSHGVPASVDAAFIAAANPQAVIELLDSYERMQRQEQYVVDLGNKRIAELESQLSAVTAAKDEACELAKSIAWKLHRECPNDMDEAEHPATLARISDLLAVRRTK